MSDYVFDYMPYPDSCIHKTSPSVSSYGYCKCYFVSNLRHIGYIYMDFLHCLHFGVFLWPTLFEKSLHCVHLQMDNKIKILILSHITNVWHCMDFSQYVYVSRLRIILFDKTLLQIKQHPWGIVLILGTPKCSFDGHER